MATALNEKPRCEEEPALPLPADSLALGMACLLGLMLAQRLVGLVRNVLFCRFLDAEQLGLWSLGFSFLMLAAPLAVLGLPGSFGRYLEHYRQRGQLRDFLQLTAWSSLALAGLATLVVCLARNWFAWFVFTDSSQGSLVLCLGVTLFSVICFNFLAELLTAMRQVRVVSLMQFANSLIFTAIGLGLLWSTNLGALGVVAAYAVACLLPCLGVLPLLLRLRLTAHPARASLGPRDIWRKLLPFAAWIWTINLLANVCEIADRYLILHWSGLDQHAALGLVGQLHASRVIPVLMTGVAMLVGGAILPYLSHDWEARRLTAVHTRINLAIKLLGLAFTSGSAVILVLSPIIFGWVLQGRYDGGLAVLPYSLMYCVWFSLALLAQNYLLCAEQTKLGGLAFALALVCNVTLNLLLLPWFGLHGAAFASAAANGLLLVAMLGLSRRHGLQIDLGTWLVCLTPVLLVLGTWSTALCVLLLAWLALWGTLIFRDEEKQQLAELLHKMLRRGRLAPPALNPEP